MKRSFLLSAVVLTLSCGSNSTSIFSEKPDGATDGSTTTKDTGSVAVEDTAIDPDDAADDSATTTDGSTPVDTGSPGVDSATVDAAATNVTVKALQDPADANHPTLNAKVNLNESGLVALTGRILTSSNTGSECRFAVWVGKPNGGDFSGIQVQEVFPRAGATSCFTAPVQKIPNDLVPGESITSVEGNYVEFCTKAGTTPCRDYEQSQIFLGSVGKVVRGSAAAITPNAQSVTVADLSRDIAAGPGPRALALEGTLVKVSGVRVVQQQQDGGTFFDTFVVDAVDTSTQKPIKVEVRNFPNTACARSFFSTKNGTTITSVTGILVPDFGAWTIKIRDEKDIGGIVCGDAGA